MGDLCTTESVAASEAVILKAGEIIDGLFSVIKMLGTGRFGAVYEVEDAVSKIHFAMKVEHVAPKADCPGLALEVSVLKHLKERPHIPNLIHSSIIKSLTYMVIQLCGDDIFYIVLKCCNKKFTLSTTIQLGSQMLDVIEELHKIDLLHRDSKPENFLMGKDLMNKRKVVDFGLVRRFRVKGKIRPPRPFAAFRGTRFYASPRVHSNQDAGRCDNLMSWFYVMVEIVKGKLPWIYANVERAALSELKKTKTEEMLAGTPPEFAKICNKLHQLGYAYEPAYGKIKKLLISIAAREKIVETEPYDFVVGGCEYEAVIFQN